MLVRECAGSHRPACIHIHIHIHIHNINGSACREPFLDIHYDTDDSGASTRCHR